MLEESISFKIKSVQVEFGVNPSLQFTLPKQALSNCLTVANDAREIYDIHPPLHLYPAYQTQQTQNLGSITCMILTERQKRRPRRIVRLTDRYPRDCISDRK